ncbi:nucleotidyltransferase family protein [Rhizobium halophytocola]|uniref:Nucleotidyltransferase n=1 Tax=Rhizobium halophytocola TaxID=735519 RepID=A0ABS4DSE7_9HYPH|nr:nucleotidyltransferase domain-containing protein [Rhizobium halophytocola]MBP1848602.1 putative nucleotidyltransferase [Rhizobium halophytocola]
MKPSEVLEKNRAAIRAVTLRHKAVNPRVFGSVARGEDGEHSDLDILVDALPEATLLDLGGLLDDLEQLLKPTPVQVMTVREVPQELRGRILSEAVAI